MAERTLHVYRADKGWTVKKQSRRAETFGTKREALAVALDRVRTATGGQVVVHGKDGRIVEHRTYGMPKVQEPPRKDSLRAKRIARAIGKVVLDRLKSDPAPPRAHVSAK